MPVDSPYPETLPDGSNLPDKQANVDLVTADWANLLQGYIIDICDTLGTNPHASAASVAARLANGLDANGFLVPPDRTRIVAKTNAPFTSIQAAVDSITDASYSKRYMIYIAPGVYDENLTLKDHVYLYGLSLPPVNGGNPYNWTVQIAPSSGNAITLPAGGKYFLSNVSLHAFDSPLFYSAVSGSTIAYVSLMNCIISQEDSGFPLLLNQVHIPIYATYCSIRTPSESDPLIQLNHNGENPFDGTFVNCMLKGKIDISGDDYMGLNINCNNVKWRGQLLSTAGNNFCEFIHSNLYTYTNPLIGMYREENAEIYALFSSFSAWPNEFPVQRLSGTNDIQFFAHYCTVTGESATGVQFTAAGNFNTINTSRLWRSNPL